MCCAGLLFLGSCSENYDNYNTDYSAYDNLKIKVEGADNNDTLYVNVISAHSLALVFEPEANIGVQGFLYEIADTLIAQIGLDGKITPIKPGVTELSVKFRGNKEIKTQCFLKITPVLITDIQITPSEPIRIKEGKTDSITRYIKVLPSNASYQELKYTVEDPTIVSIDENGEISALKEGTTNILINTIPGAASGIITKAFPVTVVGTIFVGDIELLPILTGGTATISIGQNLDIANFSIVTPENADNKNLQCTIVNGNSVVSVDDNGLITGIGEGTAVIAVTPKDGSNISKEFTINVVAGPDFNRSVWKLNTDFKYSNGLDYVPDGTTGFLSHMIDDNNATYFAINKPGRPYPTGGVTYSTPADKCYFILDLGASNQFNYFRWRHRNNNANFRAWAISILGSDDNVTYTPILDNYTIPGAETSSNNNILTDDLALPGTSNYRYVKVVFTNWNKTAGYNMQIAEFWLGKK